MGVSPLRLDPSERTLAAIGSIIKSDETESSLEERCRKCAHAVFSGIVAAGKFVVHNGCRLSSVALVLALQGAFPATALFAKVVVTLCSIDIIASIHAIVEKCIGCKAISTQKSPRSLLGKCTRALIAVANISSKISGLLIIGILCQQVRLTPAFSIAMATLWAVDAVSLVVRAGLLFKKVSSVE